jgi:hypothetical protein
MTITFASIVTRLTNPAAYRVFHQPFEIRESSRSRRARGSPAAGRFQAALPQLSGSGDRDDMKS